MRIFVSEAVCGGAWPEPELSGSLALEGRAMLLSILEDLSGVPGVQPCTTWDSRLGAPPDSASFASQSATVRPPVFSNVDSPTRERQEFERLSRSADAVLLIAPEFDRWLLSRCELVEGWGRLLLGPGSRGVALCTDKLDLARHLFEAGVPTIPTNSVDWTKLPAELERGPCVIKPRFGAGSQSTFLIANRAQWEFLAEHRTQEPLLDEAVSQPYQPGTAVSVAVLCDAATDVYTAWPVAAQILSDDGRFRYLGGRLPLEEPWTLVVQSLAQAACRATPDLRGYVGVDLVVSPEGHTVHVVEINPRLTSSYLGYRRLPAREPRDQAFVAAARPGRQLARWMLNPADRSLAVQWDKGPITFSTHQ